MHIAEGVLKPEILVSGWAIGGAALAYSFYKLQTSEIPKTAALSALFFLASFVHIPIGFGASAHLILSGFIGAFLGHSAIAAIGSALFLQGVLFSFGGVTTFGVNLCALSFPALLGFVLARAALSKFAAKPAPRRVLLFLAGATPIFLGAFLLSIILALNGEGFIAPAAAAFGAHIVIALAEGAITLLAIEFILRARPAILGAK
ncbi:MAG: cobalt transporter CbiM [Helicobacteraceae bacterium]|jgi:cobalt/nickel transport system permease protein|nr:cobalt transporter CbiM [Helicobacteraceae bacterium]